MKGLWEITLQKSTKGENMNQKKEREIDLIDMLIEWTGSWRSLLLAITLGVFIFVCYSVVYNKAVYNSLNNTQGNQISLLSEEELKSMLTVEEIYEVEDLKTVYDFYLTAFAEFEANEASLDISEKTASLYYLTNTQYLVSQLFNSLNQTQKKYYLCHYGAEYTRQSVPPVFTLQKCALLVFAILLLHFIAFGMKYVLVNTVKRTDTLSFDGDVPELTRIVDWKKIEAQKGLDRLKYKFCYSNKHRTPLEESVQINARRIIEYMNRKGYHSVALVGTSLEKEGEIIKKYILEGAPSLSVRFVDSTTHSKTGADEISKVDSAVLIAKVGFTKYNEYCDEYKTLVDRKVDIIGIVVFE